MAQSGGRLMAKTPSPLDALGMALASSPRRRGFFMAWLSWKNSPMNTRKQSSCDEKDMNFGKNIF
jgi:hypothetical protein